MTATTYVPTWAAPTASVAARGGPEHLDRNVATGDMRLSALGRPALARGAQRLVSRLVRALLTERGAWWGDPGYGSTVLPGQAAPDDLALAFADVALHEARSYGAGPLAPDERIAGVAVRAIQPGPDPRTLACDLTITTAAGTAVPVRLAV